jgi:hypothetical protein
MSRDVSLTARQAIAAPESDETWIQLLTITHPSLPEPVRVSSDPTQVLDIDDAQGPVYGTVSRGQSYVHWPFEIHLPAEDGEQLPRVRLVIDNVDRRIAEGLRTIQGPPEVALEVVLASDPDTVEAGPFLMTLRRAVYDAAAISADLAFEDILNQAIPGDSFTPATTPGLFA